MFSVLYRWEAYWLFTFTTESFHTPLYIKAIREAFWEGYLIKYLLHRLVTRIFLGFCRRTAFRCQAYARFRLRCWLCSTAIVFLTCNGKIEWSPQVFFAKHLQQFSVLHRCTAFWLCNLTTEFLSYPSTIEGMGKVFWEGYFIKNLHFSLNLQPHSCWNNSTFETIQNSSSAVFLYPQFSICFDWFFS